MSGKSKIYGITKAECLYCRKIVEVSSKTQICNLCELELENEKPVTIEEYYLSKRRYDSSESLNDSAQEFEHIGCITSGIIDLSLGHRGVQTLEAKICVNIPQNTGFNIQIRSSNNLDSIGDFSLWESIANLNYESTLRDTTTYAEELQEYDGYHEGATVFKFPILNHAKNYIQIRIFSSTNDQTVYPEFHWINFLYEVIPHINSIDLQIEME